MAERSPNPPTDELDDVVRVKLATAMSRLDDPVVLTRTTDAGRIEITFANAAFAALAGRAADDLHSDALASVLADLGCEDPAARLDDARRDRLAVGIGLLRTPGARNRREFEMTDYPLEPHEHAWLLRDVTNIARERRTSDRDRKRLEKLVNERTVRLEQFHERLRLSERLASIGTLGAGLCHDMNNLLMPIRGHLDALESTGLADDQHEHLGSIREAVDFLQQLTNGLRLFALDPDDPGAGPPATSLTTWWHQLRPLLSRTVPEQITLELDLPDDLPLAGVAAHRLTQAVLNLLINAADAIAGPGRIRLWAEASDDGRFVMLGVTDTGHGMSREARKHALDPFFTTKTRGQSTGLGLSLVHGIVHAAGGRVDIESRVGRGTTITLHLPAVELTTPPAAASTMSAVVTIDDPRIAACFTSFLRSAGFDVTGAAVAGPAASVWVTDTSPASLRQIRSALDDHASCRVVAYGTPSAAWQQLAVTIVDRNGGLEDIRNAIDQLMLAAEVEG